MKGLNFAMLVIATSIVGHASCAGVIEKVVASPLTNCTVVKNFLATTYGQFNNTANKPTSDNINVFVYGNNAQSKTNLPLNGSGNALWRNYTGFNTSYATEIFIHAFPQTAISPELTVMVDSLTKKGGSNVILMDASEYIGSWYMNSSTASAVRSAGQHIGAELAALVNNGYNKTKIHLIGFSMGAVIAGFAGNNFRNITKQSLPWITGLDPAGSCFFNGNATETLDKTDADFVDVIHTNVGIFGTKMQPGHVDFYPNGGELQPGAILPFASHALSIKLYAESVGNATSFTSVACKTWWLFTSGGCSHNARTNMGYGVSKKARGEYYLATNNGTSPFSKGDAGIPGFNFFKWIASGFVA